MKSRYGTENVAAGDPRSRGLEGGSWLGPPGIMVDDPLHRQASYPCRHARPRLAEYTPAAPVQGS